MTIKVIFNVIRPSVFAYVFFSTLLAVYTEFTSHVTFKLGLLANTDG